MIKMGDSAYYLDLDNLGKCILLKEPREGVEELETEEVLTTEQFDEKGNLSHTTTVTKKTPKSKEIDIVKYEQVKDLLAILLDSVDELDDTMGVARAFKNTTLPFKIAFNTLLKEKILVIK